MTVLETAKVTSKGQVTIPNRVRKILKLEEGSLVAFGLTKEGIVITPCKVSAESPYTPKEWEKIHKIACSKGPIYKTAKLAKKHIKAL